MRSKTLKTLIHFPTFLFGLALAVGSSGHADQTDAVRLRVQAEGELAPLPEAKPLLTKIAAAIDSVALRTAVEQSATLKMMRERVRTSLFHLNFKFETIGENYPYDPPFREPLPFRPTLEALEEVSFFLDLVEKGTGFKTDLKSEIAGFPHFAELKLLWPKAKAQPAVTGIDKKTMSAKPVETYAIFQERLKTYGEAASFPEFSEAVEGVLKDLQSEEVKGFRAGDQAFDAAAAHAIAELKEIRTARGAATRIYGAQRASFPYRKTIQALERAIMVFDLRDRLKYPEGINWHDVELSWFVGDQPKLLPLYHFNRYKYQLAGLLADPEIVLMPDWGGSSFEYLSRLRAVPIGVLEMASTTSRVDRHHNSPIDNFFHDANHIRRMWGYDQRKQTKRGAVTIEQKMEIYREQDAFVKELMAATNPRGLSEQERNMRKHERVQIFETFHETALTPDRESLLQDLLRVPATPQPFEVQVQAAISDLEEIRSFDGNLRSGADQLALSFDYPTTVRYFFDRAPGFLANVDNKQRWGFFDSPFNEQRYMPDLGYRTPRAVATAATRLFQWLGYASPPSMETLVRQITDHSGQPELWNYFGIKDAAIVKVSGLDLLNVAAADEVQDNWRRNSAYDQRWKPTNAKLKDGSIVQDQWSMARYLEERQVPPYLKQYFRLGPDPATGETILFEDIRNLPNGLMSNNHQGENLMSGAKAVSVVDRIWHNDLKFKSLDDAERWLVAATQAVHQAVLDRNANGARNNRVYNVHWLQLPAQNKLNDLDLVRIGFEARLKTGKKKLDPETTMLVRESINRLFQKVRRNEAIRSCSYSLSLLTSADPH